jgi:hypothetical protein
MDATSVVKRIREDSRELISFGYVFRLAAVEDEFSRLYPNENFGTCWLFVDRRVRQYPGLFSSGEAEGRLEGIELTRDAKGDFSLPDIQDCAARAKIRRTLESLVGRIILDGCQHVVRQSERDQ